MTYWYGIWRSEIRVKIPCSDLKGIILSLSSIFEILSVGGIVTCVVAYKGVMAISFVR